MVICYDMLIVIPTGLPIPYVNQLIHSMVNFKGIIIAHSALMLHTVTTVILLEKNYNI